VHPYIGQALAAERVGDWQRRAELARLAKQARRARRGATAVSAQRLASPIQAGEAARVPQARTRELDGAERDRRHPVGAGRG